MTFLEIMTDVAKNAGIAIPSTVATLEPDQIKLGQFINEAGREITRRVDWSALRKITTLSGTGADAEFTIANDFDRLPMGLAVMVGTDTVRGSLTADEWFALAAREGTPKYFYLKNNKISFYPYAEAGESIRVQYQSKRWVTEEATNGFDTMTKDNQETPLSGTLIIAGAVWRWRRHIGKDFADYLAEFEALLADKARYDGGVRSP